MEKFRFWILGFIFLQLMATKYSNAQAFDLIDSITNTFYQSADWQNLYNFCKETSIESFNSPQLNKRMAVAAFYVEDYSLANRLVVKSGKQNSSDSTIFWLRYWLNLEAGEIEQAGFWAQKLGYPNDNFRLKGISMEAGTKISNQEEPGSLFHAGVGLSTQLKHKLHLDQFVGWNAQQYFWENFNQFSYSANLIYVPRANWQISVPIQIASYASNITMNEQIGADYQINRAGTSKQLAGNFGLNLRYLRPNYSLNFGITGFKSSTSADFITEENVFGQSFLFRTDTTNAFQQFQVNLGAQKRFYLGKKQLKLQMQTAILKTSNNLTFLNVRPSVAYNLSPKWWLYGEFWHKDSYMLSAPTVGVFINNFNTQSERYLLSVQHIFKKGNSLELIWFTESGNDQLYNETLQYQAIFLKFNYAIKP